MLDAPLPHPANVGGPALDGPNLDGFSLARALSGLHLIGGKLSPAASGRSFAVVNPATGQEVARAAEGDAQDVDAAVITTD